MKCLILVIFNVPRSFIVQLASKEDPDSCKNAESISALLSSSQIDTTQITQGATNISIPAAVKKVLTNWDPYKKKLKDLRGKVTG